MIRFRHSIAILPIAIVSMSLLLSSCTGGASRGNDPGDARLPVIQPEPSFDGYTFTYYVHYDWATTYSWGKDETTKWIMDNRHVKVEPVQSDGAADAKLNTMIASGTLPDVIQMDRGQGVERLRGAGKLVPLDDYLQKYPNLAKEVGEKNLNMLRSPDGKLYQIPNWFTSKPNGNSGWMINTRIYEELGSPKLETFEDLYRYLKQVKSAYRDLEPLAMDADGFNIIYSGFKESTPPELLKHLAFKDDNRLKPVYEDPDYRNALAYARRLFAEELISPDALTQTVDQLKEKLGMGEAAVFVGGDTANMGEEAHNQLKLADSANDYKVIWPIHKKGLDRNRIMPNGWNSLGWNVCVITTAAKDPERIFKYFDWLVTPEGQRVVWWGPPGILWDKVDADGYPVFNNNWKSLTEDGRRLLRLQYFNFAGNATYIDSAKIKSENSLPKELRTWSTAAQQEVFWKTSMNVTEYNNLEPESGSPEAEAAKLTKDIHARTFAEAMFAPNDAEMNRIVDQALLHMKEVGLEKVLAVKTKAWQHNLSKMKP